MEALAILTSLLLLFFGTAFIHFYFTRSDRLREARLRAEALQRDARTRADRERVAQESHERARRAMEAGRVEEGLAGLFEALEVLPEHWPTHLAMADWNLRTNDFDSTMKHLALALQHAPRKERARIQARIEVLAARGRTLS